MIRRLFASLLGAGTDSSGQSYCDNCGLPTRDCACAYPKR